MMRSSSVLAKKQHNITRNNTTFSQISQNIPSSGVEILGGNESERLLSEAQTAQIASQQRYIYQSPY